MIDKIEYYIRPGALLIVFLIALFCGRRIWLKADMIMTAGFGTWLCLFPASLLKFQLEIEKGAELTPVHLHLARLCGAVFIGTSLIWWFTRDTRDGTVPITLLTTRVFSCSFLLLAQIYVQFWMNPRSKTLKWNDQHMLFGMGGACMWLLGNMIHLIWSEDYSTYPQFNIRLNTLLRVDSLLILTWALVCFAFPNVFIHLLDSSMKLDPVNTHLVRLIGVQGLGSGLISLLAPGFLREEDKKSQLFTRLLMYVPMMAVVLIEQLMYNRYSRQTLIWGTMIDLPILFNALICMVTDCTTVYRVKAE